MMETVLITGGTGALGTIVTARLVEEEYDCHVTFRGADQAERLRAKLQGSDRYHLHQTNVLDEREVADLFRKVTAHRPLHGLVHLVGGVRSFQKISETSVADWDFLLDLNLKSLFLVSRQAMRIFEQIGRGRIITIGAMASIKPSANQAGYGVAKAGVAALTKILADEGRKVGVTANCILPSVIRTEENMDWGSEEESRQWVTPSEIASTISYLLSPSASSLNGSILQHFGGLNI